MGGLMPQQPSHTSLLGFTIAVDALQQPPSPLLLLLLGYQLRSQNERAHLNGRLQAFARAPLLPQWLRNSNSWFTTSSSP